MKKKDKKFQFEKKNEKGKFKNIKYLKEKFSTSHQKIKNQEKNFVLILFHQLTQFHIRNEQSCDINQPLNYLIQLQKKTKKRKKKKKTEKGEI